jgi:hypothetical protein
MAKKKKKLKTRKRVLWTKAHDKELRLHSKAKTKVAKISRIMKRTEGALRQRAFNLGLSLGHQR